MFVVIQVLLHLGADAPAVGGQDRQAQLGSGVFHRHASQSGTHAAAMAGAPAGAGVVERLAADGVQRGVAAAVHASAEALVDDADAVGGREVAGRDQAILAGVAGLFIDTVGTDFHAYPGRQVQLHTGLDLSPFGLGLAVGDEVASGVDGHANLMAGCVLGGRGSGVGGGFIGACCRAACRVLRPGLGHSVAQHAAGLDAGLALAAGKGGGRVVEADVALAVPGPDGTLVAFVAGFGAPGVSGHFTGVLVGGQVVASAADRIGAGAGAGDLGADPAVLAQGGAHVGAAHLEGGQRVAVLHPGGADVGTLGGLELAVGAIDPVLAATLVHLVGDAQRDRVQVLVERRHRAVEQDATAEGFEGVVDEAGEGFRLQDARRGVAVAHHHHHLLGAQRGVGGVGDGVGAGDAAAGEFLDDLAQAVVGRKAVEEAFLALDVATDAGHGTFILAQVTVLEAGDLALAGAFGETAAGGDVTIEQVVAVLVQAHVQAAVALRVEAHQRAVTVDGVPALGVQVAEQAVVVGVFAVVGHGQQHVAANLALQEEGALGAGRAFAVAAAARPVLDLVLEAVAGACLVQTERTVTAQRDDALDEAGGDHVT